MKWTVVAAVIMLISCSNSERNYQTLSFEEGFYLVSSYKLPDSLGIKGYTTAFVEGTDSTYFFGAFFANGIFEYDFKNSTVRRIGRTGSGPGEYQNPVGLYYENGEISFTDNSSHGIQVIDREGQFIRKIKSKNWFGHTHIRKLGSDYYGLTDTHGSHTILRSDDKKFYNSPKYLKNFHSGNVPNLVSFQDQLLFMNPVEPKIFSVNLETSEESIQKIEGLPNFFDWETFGKSNSVKHGDTISRHRFVYYFALLNVESENYFITQSLGASPNKDPKDFINADNHILSTDGEALLNIKVGEKMNAIMAVFNNKIVTRRLDADGEFYIEVFTLSKRAKDLLK